MSSVLDQLPKSALSLQGNGFDPRSQQPSWGYRTRKPNNVNGLDPSVSELQYTYSVDGIPDVRVEGFNRAALGGVTTVKQPSSLDELDVNAPKNTQAGKGGVVSQNYLSRVGQNYKDKGPQPGRY